MTGTDYDHEKTWWDAKAGKEEKDLFDESINRALRWKEIRKHLTSDTESVLDVGGATGVFSIPLARMGYKVVHFDLSSEMIALAQEKARSLKVANLSFQQGNATDLSRYEDNQFDLVLNMDGAISFCGVDAIKAIRESIRVARRKVIMTVSNRGNMIASLLRSSHDPKSQAFASAVYSMFDDGLWHTHQFPENAQFVKGCTHDYLGPIKAFTLQEIKGILDHENMRIERLTSIGSLSNHCGKEYVQALKDRPKLFDEYIELCDRFDQEINPDSLGSSQRAGIMIVARKA